MCYIIMKASSTPEHRLLGKRRRLPSKLYSGVEYAFMIRKCSSNMGLFGVLFATLDSGWLTKSVKCL